MSEVQPLPSENLENQLPSIESFETIQQGIETYKTELRLFKQWVDSLPILPWSGSLLLENEDITHMRTWKNELRGMEKALGLNKEKIAAIRLECEVDKRREKTPEELEIIEKIKLGDKIGAEIGAKFEEIFTKEEILGMFDIRLKDCISIEELPDEKGIYYLKAKVEGKRDGEVIEHEYTREVGTASYKIEKTSYDKDRNKIGWEIRHCWSRIDKKTGKLKPIK